MLDLAASRRSGQHPEYTSTWGGVIGTLQDLKTFELVLETFSVKKHQLDTVTECAKTWRFPLQGTQYELAHDGRVKWMEWAKLVNEDGGGASEPGREDNALHDDETSSNEGTQGCSVHEAASHSNQEALHANQEMEDVNNQGGALYESWDAYEPIEPTWHLDGDNQSDYSVSSPVYNRDDYADDWDAFPEEPWMRTVNEFEVMVVRFRRRRAI